MKLTLTRIFCGMLLFGATSAVALAQNVVIHVDATHAGKPVSRYLTGACIEDVNHEIYGGIYSQMIFGESFQEPADGRHSGIQPVKGFIAIDGDWSAHAGELRGGDGPGPKLVSSLPDFAQGEVGVELFFPTSAAGNAGLILKASKLGPGADNFDGYEVSIDVARKVVILGRHHHNWTPLKEAPCDVATDRWISLSAKFTEQNIKISVDGKVLIDFNDRDDALRSGTIALRDWRRPARFRRLWVDRGTGRVDLPFTPGAESDAKVSGMWRLTTSGSAKPLADLETDRPFAGARSQRVSFLSGEGEVGIENQGLNRWGMSLVAGKPYEGYLWVRAPKPTELFVALESRDGSHRYAEAHLSASGDAWQRLNFTLTPDTTDPIGRFSISLRAPGSVVLGHAFLQPGEWGRFKNLPARRDVVQGLIDQGITVLRYGGSMVNAPEYRWKKMIGPRDQRPVYAGTWYPYSTNGWGIVDFLNLCDAAGFLGVPDFNIDESPQDMSDFLEYANGSATSPWGRRRVADGHPAPYGLRYLELGNEERVDEKYAAKFAALAKAIWAKDPQITLIVGDFVYGAPITDPMKFTGAASGITNLGGQQTILELARQHDREVWFDVHVGTDGPNPSGELNALPTYINALQKISGGAKHRVVVFELNANNHQQKRALANAWAIDSAMRDGRLPIVTSANCLQPDKENDNGWNQGLLFLNSSKVWLQPPGYVTQMIARNYQPQVMDARVNGSAASFAVTATRSEDGKTIVLQVVNLGGDSSVGEIHLDGFTSANPDASVEQLAGALDQNNTAETADAIQPLRTPWHNALKDGVASYTFAPHSFTILRFQ